MVGGAGKFVNRQSRTFGAAAIGILDHRTTKHESLLPTSLSADQGKGRGPWYLPHRHGIIAAFTAAGAAASDRARRDENESVIAKCVGPKKIRKQKQARKEEQKFSGRKGGHTKKDGMPVLDLADPSDNAFDLVRAQIFS